METIDPTEIKKKLETWLPKGWSSKVRKALDERGLSHSKSYISEVVSPKYKKYNKDIIEEALKIATENKEALEKQNQLASAL